MTSREFIRRCTNGDYDGREKNCSSIWFDGTHVYSYGSHYPLLINMAGRWILNDSGYSNTTAKHINWASNYADYRMAFPHNERLPRYSDNDSPESKRDMAKMLLKLAMTELTEVTNKINKLTPRAKQKRTNLEWRNAELVKTTQYLQNIIY